MGPNTHRHSASLASCHRHLPPRGAVILEPGYASLVASTSLGKAQVPTAASALQPHPAHLLALCSGRTSPKAQPAPPPSLCAHLALLQPPTSAALVLLNPWATNVRHSLSAALPPTAGASDFRAAEEPSAYGRKSAHKKRLSALAGVAQWIENLRVAGSIPSQGTCLGCQPGPQLGAYNRYPTDVSIAHCCFFSFFSLLSPLSRNKISKIFKKKNKHD